MASEDPGIMMMARDWDARADERIEPWSIAIEGGDPVAGAFIARYHAGASCLRCHVIDGRGGEAGPSLDGLALRSDRASILQSIIDPQAVLVEGYGTASAMPNMRPVLSPREIRDLVAYLSTLDTPATAKGH